MTGKYEIYKCKICGNVVQVLINGEGELVCCGKNMKKLEIQHDTDDIGEKHAPKKVKENEKTKAVVPIHPMTNEHYIQFIEAVDKENGEIHLKYFYPNQAPEFNISHLSENTDLIELCNIHELWGENNND